MPASSFEMRMADMLWRDGKHAVRRLAKDWQFTTGAISILALGLAANTAVFSILNQTLFKQHPFADTERLVNVYENDAKTGEPEGVSYPAFLDLQRETAVFEGVAAYQMHEGRYQTADAQGRPGAMRSSVFEFACATYLHVLGLQPSLGRWFTLEEERAAAPVIVLGWREWQRNFGADPHVLGRTVYIGGTPYQVIGVGPAALNNSETNPLIVALWMPLSRIERHTPAAAGALTRRDSLLFQVRGRLRRNVTVAQAQAAMTVTAQRFAADHPNSDPQRGITLLPVDEVRVHPRIDRIMKPVATVVLTVVGLVLAIACSNLATLLVVRGTARSAEMSVRLALGATRWQLVHHLLMESFVLSLAGAAAGVVIADWGLRYLSAADLPLVLTMQLDYRVLGFAIAVATLCGIGFGLTPALQSTRVGVAEALRAQRGATAQSVSLARGWFSLKNVLIVGQVTASFLLLATAVLAIGILAATQSRGVGFRPAGLAMIEADPRYAGYDLQGAQAVFEELRRRVAELPGAENVIVTAGLSAGGGQFDRKVLLDGASERDYVNAEGAWADRGYFETFGIPALSGRVFDEHDLPGSPEVVVVSESFARRHFGAADPVGKQVRFADANAPPVRIVGVVGDTRSVDMVADAPQPLFYRSVSQSGVMPTLIVARTSGSETAFLELMKQEVRRLRPELPVLTARTMKQHQEAELVLFRVSILSLGVLATLGLALAAVGLYAVVGFAVAQRRSEIGIRVALGARPTHIAWLVVSDVTALVLTGIAVGSLLSWTGLALFESSVAPIMGVNAWALPRVALIIVGCGALAAWAPALRALRADPIAAIRCE